MYLIKIIIFLLLLSISFSQEEEILQCTQDIDLSVKCVDENGVILSATSATVSNSPPNIEEQIHCNQDSDLSSHCINDYQFLYHQSNIIKDKIGSEQTAYYSMNDKELTALSFYKDKQTMICKDGCELETLNKIVCISSGFDGKEHYWQCNSKDITSLNIYISDYNVTCKLSGNDIESCSITYSLREKWEYYGLKLFFWYLTLAYIIGTLFTNFTYEQYIVLYFLCVFITRFVIRLGLVLDIWFG